MFRMQQNQTDLKCILWLRPECVGLYTLLSLHTTCSFTELENLHSAYEGVMSVFSPTNCVGCPYGTSEKTALKIWRHSSDHSAERARPVSFLRVKIDIIWCLWKLSENLHSTPQWGYCCHDNAIISPWCIIRLLSGGLKETTTIY